VAVVDEATKERIVAWEKHDLKRKEALELMSALIKSDEVWVFTGEAGKVACIAMMLERMETCQ
jgi:hypothetical protein